MDLIGLSGCGPPGFSKATILVEPNVQSLTFIRRGNYRRPFEIRSLDSTVCAVALFLFEGHKMRQVPLLAAALVFALLFVAGLRFGSQPCLALDVPMTHDQIKEAIALGDSSTVQGIVGSSEWALTTSDQSWPDYTAHGSVSTPFFMLAFEEASADSKYQKLEPKDLLEVSKSHEITFDVFLFNPTLSAYDDAVGVIKQGASIIHSTSRTIDDPDVVDDPEVGYRYFTHFTFDMSKLNKTTPFTFAIANIPMVKDGQLQLTGEIDFSVDPTSMR